MYLVNITTDAKSYNKKVIATNTGTSPSISFIKTNNNLFRDTNSLVEMQYNSGDQLGSKKSIFTTKMSIYTVCESKENSFKNFAPLRGMLIFRRKRNQF